MLFVGLPWRGGPGNEASIATARRLSFAYTYGTFKDCHCRPHKG